MREIDTERFALKAVRGDFGPLGPGRQERDSRASHALPAPNPGAATVYRTLRKH
jgi:hypothetical protein